MILKAIYISTVFVLLSACSAVQLLPPELSGDSANAQLADRCRKNFVQGNWQFVHSINFTMTNGHGTTIIGVTVLEEGNIRTALMGVEGFVFFEAELAKNGNLDVKRALPPFDNAEFASGLLRDVQDIFLLPTGDVFLTGKRSDGSSMCRYTDKNDILSDLVFTNDGSTVLTIYDADDNRMKSIIVDEYGFVDGERIPETVHLQAYGMQGYSLNMKLISADKM